MNQPHLAGKRVLLVEDEAMVSMMIEDLLAEFGCAVAGTAAKLSEALQLAEAGDFDCAVLDLNLDGKLTYPVADILMRRGLPFMFLTGYGSKALPERYQHISILQKPFYPQEFERRIAAILRPANSSER